MSLRRHDVEPIGAVTTGSLLWRSHGRLHLTVIVKASYGLKPGGAMRPVEPPPLNDDEVHYDGRPTRSVKLPSDDVPYLSQTDVLFSGSVFSPAKLPIPFTKVRLAVHGEGSLVDKTLHVHGDRPLGPTGPGAAQPFTVLPLVYERALRDPEGADNPVGIDPQSAGAYPNIVYPDDPERVAGFGPISRYWRARRACISPESRELLGRSTMELASDFDWSYFQAAPADQRCRHLAGDEWVVVEGMDPKICAVHSRLPGGVAVACVWSANRNASLSYPVQMNADTLFIDGDARTCTVTWRGSFPIARPEVLDAAYIAAGVHHAAEPIDWPAAKAAAARSRPRPACTAVLMVDEQGFLTSLEPDELVPVSVIDSTDAESLVLSSSDLVDLPESLPGSAVSLDPDELEEIVEAPVAADPLPPAPDREDPLAADHFGFEVAPDRSGEVANTAEDDDLLAKTTVSSVGADDVLLQTVAIPPGDDHPRVAAPAEATPAVPPGAAAPPSAAVPASAVPPSAASGAAADPLLQTLGLADSPVGAAATPWDRPGLPPAAAGADAPAARAAPAETSAEPAGEEGLLGQTMGLDEVPRPDGLRSTLDAAGAPPGSLGAPYAVAERAAQSSGQPVVLRPAAFPGAPWSDEPGAPVLPPTGDPLAETYRLDPALAAAAKATPAGAGTSNWPPPPSPVADRPSAPGVPVRDELLARVGRGQSAADLDLSHADLSGLDLTGAQLAGADLTQARLDGAKLDGANLRGCVLRGASLSGVSLHRADLGEVDGVGASFERAAGYEVSFARGNWREARFFDAQIDQADFSQAVLDRAVLDSAALRQARLDDVRAIDLRATGANLFEVTARRAVLLHSHFAKIAGERSQWHDSVLDDSSFVDAALEGASLAGASCQRVDFARTNLRGAQLTGARLHHTSFRQARLSTASLVGLDLSTADLTDADQDD